MAQGDKGKVNKMLKRLFIMDYKPHTNDGLGAKFIFPRQVDGEAFLTNAGDVRFVAQVSSKINLNEIQTSGHGVRGKIGVLVWRSISV